MTTFFTFIAAYKILAAPLLSALLFKWHFLIPNPIFWHNYYRNHMQNLLI
jgi:hypothetical protein